MLKCVILFHNPYIAHLESKSFTPLLFVTTKIRVQRERECEWQFPWSAVPCLLVTRTRNAESSTLDLSLAFFKWHFVYLIGTDVLTLFAVDCVRWHRPRAAWRRLNRSRLLQPTVAHGLKPQLLPVDFCTPHRSIVSLSNFHTGPRSRTKIDFIWVSITAKLRVWSDLKPLGARKSCTVSNALKVQVY